MKRDTILYRLEMFYDITNCPKALS